MGQSKPDVGVKRGSQSFPILGGWVYSATNPVVSKLTQSYVCTIQEEMIFQIPWKHAAKHGWDINKDACLFRSWAIHTGVQGGGAEKRAGEAITMEALGSFELLDTACRIIGAGVEVSLCFPRMGSIVLASSQRIYKGENLRKHAFRESVARIQLFLAKRVVSQATKGNFHLPFSRYGLGALAQASSGWWPPFGF